MDKEDCIQVLLSTLQQPLWKSCDSVTDWDLKNVLWKAGLLLTPEQVAALFADMKRRGLISARERRSEDRIAALWGVKITPAGEDWIAHVGAASVSKPQAGPAHEGLPPEEGQPTEPLNVPASPSRPDLQEDSAGNGFGLDISVPPYS